MSSHRGVNAPRPMQRLSKGYVGAVSFKSTDFHVLTFHVYFPKVDLLDNLPVIDT